MWRFEYHRPTTLSEAFYMLSKRNSGTWIVSGGTDLIPKMRSGQIQPKAIIDISKLPLAQIKVIDGHVSIGARVTHTQIIRSPCIGNYFPILIEACSKIGSPSIRNIGTIGGNLVNASPAADSVLPLLVYDAYVVVKSEQSERHIPLSDLFIGPGKALIDQWELLTEIIIPVYSDKTIAKFLKLGRRKALSISVANLAIRLNFGADNEISAARIAIGSVAPIPMRVQSVEKMLEGEKLTPELIEKVSSEVRKISKPITDVRGSAAYRRKVIGVLSYRALVQLQKQILRTDNNVDI